MLQMRFFGSPIVTLDGRVLTPLTRSPILTHLLAFLVTHRNRPHSRLVLAALFWPELPESQARQYLNTHLWRLRSLLDTPAARPAYVLSDKQTVQFNSTAAFWLDVTEFEAATASLRQIPAPGAELSTETVNRLEYVAELYSGDFLEGVYADWCLNMREQLREQYLLAVETLVRAHRAAGRNEAALSAAQRLAQADPCREEAHFQLVELYAASGRCRDAQAQCQRYEAIWRDELHLEPSARMRVLSHRIDSEVRNPPYPSTNEASTQDAQLLEQLAILLKRAPAAVLNTEEPRLREQLWDQVAEYGKQVGLILKARYANAEALRYFTLALDALASLPDSCDRNRCELSIRRECDELYDFSVDREKQVANLQRFEQLAGQLGDLAVQADALFRRAWLESGCGNCPEAVTLLQRMLRLCQEEPEACGRQTALAYRSLGVAYDRWNDFQSALQYHTQALALDEAQQDQSGMCIDFNNIAGDWMMMGDYPAALSYLERASDLITPQTLPLVKVLIVGKLGRIWLKLGQLAMADKCLREAVDLVRQISEREAECWVCAQQATLYQCRGETDRALQIAHHYYQVALEIAVPYRISELAELLAGLYVERRDGYNALVLANKAVEVAQMYALQRRVLRGLMRRAQAYLLLENPARAFECMQEAVRAFEWRNQPSEEEAEMFWIYAQSAQAIGRETPAASARHYAEMALLRMANLIVDVKLREGFLQFHPVSIDKTAALASNSSS